MARIQNGGSPDGGLPQSLKGPSCPFVLEALFVLFIVSVVMRLFSRD